MRFEKDIVFVINQDLISKINKCIKKAYPNEASGFLFGDIEEVNNDSDFRYKYYSKSFQCIQSSVLSPVSFSIDNNNKIIELSNKIKKEGLKLLAIFHSHPAGAYPSNIDRKSMKYYHNCGIKKFAHLVWIIVNSRNKKINGFIYLDNNLTQIQIEVSKD